MVLHERIREIRKERGWSQIDLAEQSDTDPRQISRYENGHIKPSVEVIVRMARALNITLDYLLIEEATKRPLTIRENALLSRSYDVEQLNEKERDTLAEVLDALVAKSKVRRLVSDLPK